MTVFVIKEGKPKEYLFGQVVPQVGNLFIDKLYMTYQIPANLHEVIKARFQDALTQGNGITAFKVSKTGYKNNIKLSTEEEGDVLIQCAPYKSGLNFFRLECTPSKVDMNILKTQLDFILKASGGYSGLIKKGVVTRIDFTVDAAYINPTDILASYPKMKVETLFAKNGIIETKYLGSPTSNKQVVLYDKVAEMVFSKKDFKEPMASALDHKLLRIEFRLQNSNSTLKELEALPNPFEGLSLTAYPESKSMKNYAPLWSLFLSACRFEGITKALQHLNEQDRKHYQSRLKKEGKTEWWRPVKVWEGLPDALKVITHAKGYTPK